MVWCKVEQERYVANSTFDENALPRPPLSTHPAFPAIVALWFAALLGLGTLVMPAALFERAFATVGMTSQIPLGFATQSAIAVVAGLIGASAGLAIARRVAAVHARTPRLGHAAPSRPLRVREELDPDNAPPAEPRPATRRRALAIVSEETAQVAPPEHSVAEDCETADQTDSGQEPSPSGEDSDEPLVPLVSPPPAYDELGEETEREAEPPLDAMSGREPRAAAVEPRSVRDTWTDLPPDQLGLVQLLERLGATLERRREWQADGMAPAPAAPTPTPAIDAAQTDEAERAMADYFGRSFAPAEDLAVDDGDLSASLSLPLRARGDGGLAALRSAPDAEDPRDGGAFGSLLAMRSPYVVRDEEAVPADDDSMAFEYAHPQRPFDPPGAASEPFDAGARQGRADADAQLRAALTALQRTRGAA